jgi:FixJ family two-component response regulator
VTSNSVIAIVDDDTSVRAATTCLMRSLGYVVYGFASAEEFLGSPHLADISCLIADVQMPGMGGVELQRRLIAQGRNIPLILISAFPGERLKAARVLGADAICFLSKPFATRNLLDCIETALRSKGEGAPD